MVIAMLDEAHKANVINALGTAGRQLGEQNCHGVAAIAAVGLASR
jgi:hypothetical protein